MSRALRILCVLTPLLMAGTGYFSLYLSDWWLENLLVFALLLGLVSSHRRLPLSDASYALLFVFLCLHEYGALYAYSNVPLAEALKPWIGASRNHYDRLVHFLFGLMLLLPVYEAAGALTRLRGWIAYALPVQCMLASSALYEIIEWIVAMLVNPELGTEFVGAQGDDWDSVKDMALALAGSMLALAILAAVNRIRHDTRTA